MRHMAASRINALQDLMLALADTTRLRLLSMMRSREICVCFFTAVIDAPQPTISRHLAYLRGKGLVESRREGKWMHYRMVAPRDKIIAQALDDVLRAAAGDPQIQADAKRLAAACCDPQTLVGISDAPLPVAFPR
jgi:ArsR family transcriptional regulator, arsenate/arsenite/antimonite-responsive transcriptional repressor